MVLGEWFLLIARAPKEDRPSLAGKCMREHGGLGKDFRRKMGRKVLEPFEICSVMFEALLTCPDSWDPAKGGATIHWATHCRRIAYHVTEPRVCTIGSVRVPRSVALRQAPEAPEPTALPTARPKPSRKPL